MKVIFVCFQLIVLVIAQEYYNIRYDSFDIEPLLKNRRLLLKYMNCFIDKGPCPPVGRVFRDILPEVVRSRCAKCSPRQQVLARKAFNAFKRDIPDSYNELKRKIDPQNKYFVPFEKSLTI